MVGSPVSVYNELEVENQLAVNRLKLRKSKDSKLGWRLFPWEDRDLRWVLLTYLVQDLITRIWKMNFLLECVAHFVQLFSLSPVIECSSDVDLFGFKMRPAKKMD